MKTSVSSLSSRGPGFALLGGAIITLGSLLIGALFVVWFVRIQEGPQPADMLPADTQVYLALTPTVSNVPEQPRIAQGLREILGLQLRDDAAAAVAALFGVTLSTDLESWIGSDLGLAVRAYQPQSGDPLEELLTSGQVALFLSSRNDPQAELFLSKTFDVRGNRGESISSSNVAAVTIYSGTPGSLFSHVALIEHYVVFSNDRAFLTTLIQRNTSGATLLSATDAYRAHLTATADVRSATYYSDGSPAAEAARAALRSLLQSTVAE